MYMPSWLVGFARSAGVVILAAATIGATSVGCRASPPVPEEETPAPAPPAAGPPDGQILARGLELIRAGRTEQARELLAPVVAARPDWAAALATLGFTYFNEKRWEPALDLYERALLLDPNLHAARVPHGWCLYYLGQLEPARASFLAYLEIDPDYPDAVLALGLIDFDTDDLPSAERRFRRAIVLARARKDVGRQALAHTRLGDLYLRTGDLQRARTELERSIELDPGNHKAYFKMSRVLQLLGDADGAAAARAKHDRLREAREP